MKKSSILCVMSAVAFVCLASCGGKGRDAMFTFALSTEVDDYDPFTNLTADGRSVLFNIYEGLVRVSPNEEASGGRFLPCLADSYEHNEDFSEWTFHIKSNVHFHDGSVLTSKDASLSITKAIDAAFAGCDNIKEVLDEDGTVTVRLKKADTSFDAVMTCPIVKYNERPDTASNAAHRPWPVGTGPYMLKDYKAGDYAILVRFDGYHAKKASLPAVKVKFIGTQAALPLSLLSGAVDGFVATGDLSGEVSNDKGIKYSSPSNAVQMLALNNDAAPFRDEKVRRALRALIDADDVIKTASGGYGVRAAGPVIPALMSYNKDVLDDVPYNKEKGIELLKEAGAEGLSFAITVPSNYTVHVKAAEVIVEQLARAGIKCDVKQVDWAAWLSEVYMGRHYEATIISVDAPLAVSSAFLSRYVSDAGDNFVNFKSNAFDKAFIALQGAKTDEEKTLYTKNAVKILIDEAASVWIEDIEQVTVYSKRFEGFLSYPLFAIDFSAIQDVGGR